MKIDMEKFYKNYNVVLTEEEKAKIFADLEEENSMVEEFENLEMAL